MWARYNRPEDIRRILAELDEEDPDVGCAFTDLVDDFFEDPNDIDYEPEQIETEDHDSESEEEMDEANEDEHVAMDGEDGDMETEGDDLGFYIGKDGKTIWASDVVADDVKTKYMNTDSILPGPKGGARRCVNELECFSSIMTPEIIDNIVQYTNIYIQMRKNTHPDSRERDWRHTNKAEILAFLGALFLISVKRWNRTNLSEFFAADGTGLTILRANFSENRFRFLLRSIRFDNVNTRKQRVNHDKLAPIRELFVDLVRNCQKSYDVGEFVTVDEMLVAFRGSCSFIQYMARKSAKYGIKIYAMCDARTFYTYNMEIYCGKQTNGPFAMPNKPYDVVVRLIDPIKNSNRNVTVDNYFSSYPLADYLLTNGLTFLGTLKKNKREIPAEFIVENTKLVPGTYMFGAQYDKTLVSMATKKKKVMLVLSTMHDTNFTDEETGKPYQIMDYISTKGAVDNVGLMCSRCTTSIKTKRWPVVIFYRLLDIAGINSFKIFQGNNPGMRTKRRTYIFNLALALMEENLKYRATLWSLPSELQGFLKKYKGPVTEVAIAPRKIGICYCCGTKKNNKTAIFCHKCNRNVCRKHSFRVVTCHPCVEDGVKREENEDV